MYKSDALYRLIEATDHDLSGIQLPTNDDFSNGLGIPHPAQNVLPSYTQQFAYSECGNLIHIKIMRKTLLLIAFLLFLSGCGINSPKTLRSESSELPDSIELDLTVIIPNVELFPLLDSIINVLNRCPIPKGNKIEMFISVEQQEYGLGLFFNTISRYYSDSSSKTSIFDYKGFRFYYTGVFLDNYFVETDNIIKMRFINPSKLIFDIDDRDYKWVYAVKNGIIEGILVKDCNKLWVNWDYFPGED